MRSLTQIFFPQCFVNPNAVEERKMKVIVPREPKARVETSKKILLWTGIIFSSQIIAPIIFVLLDKPTDVFVYTVPASSGIFGSAIIFYLNKAKIENIFKGKIDFLKYKLDLLNSCKTPEERELVEKELGVVDETLDTKINDSMTEAVQETITTPMS